MGKEDQVQAFRLFDFDKSEEFKAYMRNIELPPGDKAMLKAKAKWYKRTQDPDFEIEWLPGLAASQAAPTPAAAAAPAGPPPAQQQRQAAPAAAAGGGGGAAAAAGRSAAWQQGRQVNLALLQVMVVAFSFLYLQPLHRGWSSWAYSKLMLVLVFSQALKVNTAHGWPAGWSLSAIQQWLMRVVLTSDAQYFLLAFAAAGNSKPVTAVLPPFLVLAAYQLAHFLASTFGSHPLWQRHGVHLYRQMQAKQQVALAFNAQSEIMLGFLLLLGLPFPGRAPMLAFMVAQFLRMRYWSSDGALYHRQAWMALGNLTAHFRQQFPILQRAVDFGVGFFHQGRPAAA